MLLSKLTQFWSTHPQLHTQTDFVVALSGGIDSVSLLHGLLESNLLPKNKITVAYVNHHWRPEAKDEERFVLSLGEEWGVRAVIKQATEVHTENQARQARYRLLADAAHDCGATAVLTAHHADDQAETFLLHLLRGSGLAGLTGMAPISPYPLPEFANLQLIRPLLTVSKAEIKAYAQSKNLAFMEDKTNEDIRYTRNKIRHELLPTLEEYNGNISEQLSRTAALLADDYQFIAQALEELWPTLQLGSGKGWLKVSLSGFLAQTETTQRHLLRHIVKSLLGHTQDLTYDQINQARAIVEQRQTGSAIQLPHDVTLHTYYDSLIATTSNTTAKSAFDAPQLQSTGLIQLSIPCTIQLSNGWQLKITRCSKKHIDWAAIKSDPYQAVIALPETETLTLRGRLPGDRFQPFSHHSSKKLKDWLITRKIPSVLRDHWPLVTHQQSGEILWVAGQDISQTVAIDPQQTHSSTAVYLQIQSAVQQKERSDTL